MPSLRSTNVGDAQRYLGRVERIVAREMGSVYEFAREAARRPGTPEALRVAIAPALDVPEGRQLDRQAVAQSVSPGPQPLVWAGRHRKF